MAEVFLEEELYLPVKKFFEERGFKVNGEVRSCDLAAEKDGKLVVAEFKMAFSLRFLYQLCDRQSFSDNVYAVLPRPKAREGRKAWESMNRVLKRLNIGLITVALDSPSKFTELIIEPDEPLKNKNRIRTRRVKKEMSERSLDLNAGGSVRKKLVTAYREKIIELAVILEENGPLSAKGITDLGFEGKAQAMLSKNYYGWFEKAERGIYRLSEKGAAELKDEGLAELTRFYREKWKHTQ